MILAIGIWQAILIGVLIFGILILTVVINYLKKKQKKK